MSEPQFPTRAQMEREILYRGKRRDNGKWWYGSYLFLHIPAKDWTGTERGPAEDVHFIVDETDLNYAVDPATVGQYTGLTDRNGVKIFEGDILSTTNSNCRIWYVDYKIAAFCANQGNANYSCELGEFILTCMVEVIGNIHDNPDLMEAARRHT